ncbi:MAG TPA: sulfite exporter TauE/SafE family protein, partial [Hydrogenophaga sp.]
GSFLTFPALVFTGVPPIVANATSALAVSPGYLGSTLGFRPELRALPMTRLRREMLIAAVGGVAGALLLLVTPAKVFSGIVPWLLLFATVLFAAGPAIARRARAGAADGPGLARWREPGLLAVAIYGGYFNGGLGILLMALYTLTGEGRIHTVNALKNLNSLVLSWLSVAAFVIAGAIAWKEGLLMMVAATAGGFFGARWSKRLPAQAVRIGVIVTGLVMTALFFWRG